MEFDLTPEGLAKGNLRAWKLQNNEIINARALIQEGRLSEALVPMIAGLIVDPKNPATLQNLSNYFEAKGEMEASIGVAKGSTKIFPDDPAPLLFLAEKYIRNREHKEALECCNKVIQMRPQSAVGWRTKGDIFWMLGRLDEAFECSERLLECDKVLEKEVLVALDRFDRSAQPSALRKFLFDASCYFPGSLTLKILYSEALLKDGRPGDAIRSIKETGALKGDPLASCVLVRAYIDLGRPEDGLKFLTNEINAEIDNPNVEALRAVCLRLTGQVTQAKHAYEKLLKVGVENIPLLVGYATCLAILGLDYECLKALNKGLEIEGQDSGLLVEKANCLSRLSKRGEARECIRSAGMAWHNPISFLEGPSLVNAEFEDNIDWNNVEKIFNQGTLSRNERLNMLFALGHQRDRNGEYKEAMSLWSNANAEIRSSYNFNCKAFVRWMKEIPEIMTSLSTDPVCNFDEAPFRPIFVFGMPRSGTSLVEHVLSSHSAIKAGGESKNVNRLIEEAMSCFPGTAYPNFLAEFDNIDYLALREKFFSYWKFANLRESFVVDKLPGNFIHLKLLAKLFPEAIFIECRRDPYDTALSIFGHWFREGHPYAYDLKEILMIQDGTDEVMKQWRAELGEERIHTIQYEKLVRLPGPTIEALIGGCNLTPEEPCFLPHKNLRPIDNANARRLETPITDARTGRAQNYAFAFENIGEVV